MGKKKNQQHLQQSMGNMVSKAALAQMGPHIEQMVVDYVNQLGSNLSNQVASTMESMFSRIVVLESIVTEKLGYTKDDLASKVADIEDGNMGLEKADEVQKGDVVRIEISTKHKDQPEYQGSSRLRVSQVGTGQTLGTSLENLILGMKAGETKESDFDDGNVARIVVNRVSRPKKKQTAEVKNESTENTAQG